MNSKEEYITFIESKDVELFVGKNYQKYKERWLNSVKKEKHFKNGNLSSFSFNLLALVALPAWLGYRKMYLFFFSFLGLLCLITLGEYLSGYHLPTTAFTGGLAALSFLMNGFYFTHIYTSLKKTNAVNKEEKKIYIQRKGGTSIPLAFGYLTLSFVLLILSSLLGSYIAHKLGIEIPSDKDLLTY